MTAPDSGSRRRSGPPGQARAEPRLTTRQAVIYTAAALIFAALHLLFAGLALYLPLGSGLTFQVAPGLGVPLFMGLIAGPVAGLWVGLAGRLLGDALGGLGVNGVGLLYTGALGLIAGLGWRGGGYRTLRGLLRAGLWVALAAAGAGLLGGAAHYLTIIPGDPAAAIDQALSSAITAGLTGWLLLPGLLAVHGGEGSAGE